MSNISISLPTSEFVTALALGVVGALVGAVLQRSYRTRFTSKEGHPLPPGPPALWFWENIIPPNVTSTFTHWGNVYGPVFTLRQGSEIMIVVTAVEAATEIMEKEGSALADRPPMIAASELLSGGKRIALISSGDKFRRLRKVIHAHFQPKAMETYRDIHIQEARTLVLDLLRDPEHHQGLMRRYSTSIILRITYGKSSPLSMNEPEFAGVKEIAQHFLEGTRPGAYLIDRFHWLKYVPGYGRRLKEYYKSDLQFYKGQLDGVQHALSSGDAGPSFSKTILENAEENGFSYDEMAFLAGTLFEAGSDTTASAMIGIIMAAACFPDEQLRVQEELDKVVGMDRLPSLSDWDALPRLRAFISEALRWRPITPNGFPHRSTRDIIWRGYYIPAGTTVHQSLWAISRDSVAFPDPEKFDHRRWLDQRSQLRSDVECYSFGFGRRLCPGLNLANHSMFIGLAHLLWSFRVVERPDAPIDRTPGADKIPAQMGQFKVDFVPRISEAQLREIMAT